ncbi:hypothetical protein CLOSTMETH_01001 [[Clostridium] methylpentosum DSM 5476]|uniref:Uncharacterized protein n=1 Tax=[Clostridium] methylpentosum DSM 5476 TaxID=537013 RepID=C0EAY5_9FIRM|nr:hypothetical protein CLOSTMETH_01001 [[Clostridium] methylpentosum DSM 5476]
MFVTNLATITPSFIHIIGSYNNIIIESSYICNSYLLQIFYQ